MNSESLGKKLNKLYYLLDDLYGELTKLRDVQFRDSNYNSVLRAQTISVHISDLLSDLNSLSEIKKDGYRRINL